MSIYPKKCKLVWKKERMATVRADQGLPISFWWALGQSPCHHPEQHTTVIYFRGNIHDPEMQNNYKMKMKMDAFFRFD